MVVEQNSCWVKILCRNELQKLKRKVAYLRLFYENKVAFNSKDKDGEDNTTRWHGKGV